MVTRVLSSAVFALAITTQAYAQTINLGGRFMFHHVLIGWRPALTNGTAESTFYRPGYQLGLFGARSFNGWLGTRAELNFSRMGYTIPFNSNKIDYNYVGISLIPTFKLRGPFNIGLGAAINRLINDPDDVTPQQRDSRPKSDFSLSTSLFLRYNRFEIQARGQLSLNEFNPGSGPNKPYFRTLGVGAAYYF